MEEYKKVKSYDNYSVSNFGNVRNDTTNRILKPGINSRGYCYVNLCNNNKKQNMTIHRLIALAFIPNPDNKKCIDHIDNSKINNNINNLRWVTYSENNMNRSMHCNNSSGFKGISWIKTSNKWSSQIRIDDINIHLGLYNTKEQAAKARVKRVEQAFGIYKNECEGIDHGAKPMKMRKAKTTKNPIVKLDIKQIFDEIVKLKESYKDQKLKFQKQLQDIMNI
jgi:hypothetical protein